jgi:hypothetical protein
LSVENEALLSQFLHESLCILVRRLDLKAHLGSFIQALNGPLQEFRSVLLFAVQS